MDVTLKNNTNQSLSVYYYAGVDERVADLPPGKSIALTNVTSISPSTDRLIKSKYISVVYSTPETQAEVLPVSVNGMAWAGSWNQNISYIPGYAVSFLGSVWVAKKPSKNSEPALLSQNWDLIGISELNALLQVDINTIPIGSIIYRDEFGWTAGPLSDSSISGTISIGKINGLSDELSDKLSKSSGGAITGNTTYSGSISANGHLVNKQYADGKLALTGGTVTGAILSDPAVPVINQYQLTTKEYVDGISSGNLPLSGGALTGLLTLSGTPINPGHAANKEYVDTKLSRAGGTMSGPLILNGLPEDPLHAANKEYVDTKMLEGGVLTGKFKLPVGFTIDDAQDLVNKSYVDLRSLEGGVLTGKLKLPTNIAVNDNADLTNKLYVDQVLNDRLARTGGLMTGLIYYNVQRVGVSVDPITDIFTFQSHGFKGGRSVIPLFTSGFAGITSGATYYVVPLTGASAKNGFKLASTFGNSTTGEAGSTTLLTSSTASLTVGQEIGGSGFQTGTIISRIDSPTSFTISNTLLLPQPVVIDITTEGIGATFKYATQEPDDQIPSKDYVDDALGISGETLNTGGGTMLGPILGSHGLLQLDGNTAMTGSIVLADLPDITLDGSAPREWAILAFSYHSSTESRVYLDDVASWSSHHDIRIFNTGLYDGVHEVVLVDKEEGFLVIEREFDGTVSGYANQFAGGLYFSTTENGISYRRRKLVSRGALSIQSSDYSVQPIDGIILSNSTGISLIDLGDPAEAIGQVVVKKIDDSTGSFVIVKGGNGGGDSNLVLDTKNDAVVMESLKDRDGNPTWMPVSRIRNGEDVARVIFNGCFLRYPGSMDIDITTQRSFEKTAKVTQVVSVTVASVSCLELTVDDATDFQTAGVITIEGSVNGYNGNYGDNNIISIDTTTRKIVLANINDVAQIVNESNFFIIANVNKSFKSNLAFTISPVVNDIRQTRITSKIAGFSSAGSVFSEPSSSSEESPGYTDVILGNNITIESVENIPVSIDGISTSGVSSPYSLFRPGHGLVNGDEVVFTFDGPSSSSSSSSEAEQFGGLISGETYYVVNVADELDDEFDLSIDNGGVAIPVTSQGVNGVITKVGSSGILKVSLNREEFDGAFTSGELVPGDRININWTSTGSGSYDGSYLVDDVDVGDNDTLPSVTIRGQYIGDITSDHPKMSEAVDTSEWIPGFHLVQISNYPDYNGVYDLMAVDAAYGKLTIKKPYVAPAAPAETIGIDVVSRPSHIINPHPSVFGKILNGEGGDMVSARTDGDGDITIRLRNPVTDVTPGVSFPNDITGISNEITGSYLHAISGGVFDLTGEVAARIINTLVYSATITGGGGTADINGNITLEMNNVIGFREGDLVRISTESVDRTVVSLDNDNITIDGGDYTVAGSTSLSNNSAMVLVLDDMSSGAFDVGDPIIVRDVTSLGNNLIKTTVAGVSPLVKSPYTAPRIIIRGFNKSIDDPDGEPIPVQVSLAEDALVFESVHNLQTGQKIRATFASSIYVGFSTSADVYAIRTGVSTIRIATSQINSYDGRFINLTASGSGTVTPLVTVSTAFDPTGSLTGTVEVPKVLSLYSIRPWVWMSWRGAATLVGGNNVSSWDDYSGNLRHFLQGTSGNRPVYATSGFNGVSAIRYLNFTANNKSIAYPLAFDKTQSVSIMFVAKMSADGTIFKSGSMSFSRSSGGYQLSGTGGSVISGGKSGTAAGVYTLILNGGSSRFRKFTSFASSPQEVFGSILGDLVTEISIGSNTGSFNGNLATFMVLSSALNEDQISFLERSLAYEHGITTLSNNAYLNSLSLLGSTGATILFNPAFNGYTTSGYSASVANSVVWARATAVPLQPNASMRVNVNSTGWTTLVSGSQSGNLSLNAGANTIEVEVTAQDDTTEEVYQIQVIRRAPPTVTNPSVTSIGTTAAVLGGTVSSDNGASIAERGIIYSLTSVNSSPTISGSGVTQVPAGGTTGSFTSSITGLVQGSGYSFRAYAINAEGVSYTVVTAFSTLSTNANLSALVLSSGTLVPAFDPGTTSYTASVSVASMTVTPTVAQANATVAVNPNSLGYTTVTSGSPSGSLALNPGSNTIAVKVTAQDGVTEEVYSTTVTRMVAPTITSPTVTGETDDAAILGGNVTSDGGATITERGVVYSETTTNSNPLIGGSGVTKVTTSGTTGVFTVPVTGLTAATGYSYKAYATNSQGTSYTSVDTFTTNP